MKYSKSNVNQNGTLTRINQSIEDGKCAIKIANRGPKQSRRSKTLIRQAFFDLIMAYELSGQFGKRKETFNTLISLTKSDGWFAATNNAKPCEDNLMPLVYQYWNKYVKAAYNHRKCKNYKEIAIGIFGFHISRPMVAA